jgi:hypothetical protein
MTKFTIDPEYMEKYKDAAFVETYTGRKFYPALPRVEDLTILDIAHALSLKCRYGGHTRTFYSVAEHCVVMALFARHLGLSARVQYHLLMHEGGEGYLPDVPRPIKHFFPDLIVMEKNLDATVREWSGLDHELPPELKEFDSRIIRDERMQVLTPSGNKWQTDELVPLGVICQGWTPAVAEVNFLQAYQTISREHTGKHRILSFADGAFGSSHGLAGSDARNFVAPNIRILDIPGKCAVALDDRGAPYYIHGDFDLVYSNL